MTRKSILDILVILAAAVLAAGSAAAQPYPSKPIHLVVPFGPGGSNDIVGRILAAKLTESVGQPVIADNRPGAGGTVGTDTVVKSPPDGYTVMIGATKG